MADLKLHNKPPVPNEEALPAARANVLLVDDQPARLLSHEAVLAGLGVRCVRALSGREALAALLSDDFAVIILDIQMPEMDGFEVARLIRSHPRYENAPIIFVTGVHVSELDQLKGYASGAIDYLSVPVVPELLRSKVAVLVELYHRRRELKALNESLEGARHQLESEHARITARFEQQFERLFEHPSDLVAILRAQRDADGRIVDWVLQNVNRNSLRFLSAVCDHPIGASIYKALGERAPKVAGLAERVLIEGEPISYEDQVRDRCFLITMFAFDADSVVSSAREITARKRAEHALRENERRFRALIEDAPVAVAHNAPDGRFEYVNKGFCRLLGYSAGELLTKTWQEVTHPDDVARDAALGRKALGGESPSYTMQKRYLRKDGATVWVELFGNFVLDDDGAVIQGVAVAVDISARREAETRLQESGTRFRELANNIDQLAWACSSLGVAEWYNDRWYEYTGMSFDEMQGTGWTKLHDPAHLPRVLEGLKRSADTGKPWEDTFPLRGKDGQFRWFLSRATPIRDAEGRVVRWLGTNTDVTEQRRLQEALRESGHRKDEFLAMLSHELRNPIAPIRNAAEVLSRLSFNDERQAGLVGIIQRQTQHFSKMLDDLLDVARITQGRIELRCETVDVWTCAAMAMEMAEPAIRARAHQLTVAPPTQPLHVWADRERLVMCLANLLSNAAKYTPAEGQIRVQAHAHDEQAVVQITDSGRGIPGELLPRVFDLFVQEEQTLDRTDGGLGIGLYICKQVIEMHGGTVEASSAGRGLGATFTIRLPLMPQRLEQASAPVSTAGTSWRVLVVDDNRDAADTTALLLRLDGHTTSAVYSAESALQQAAEFNPDVVLLDIGLPRMDGYTLARHLREVVPRARFIAVTGYGRPEDRERSAAAGFHEHLVKPIGRAELERLLVTAFHPSE